jgi:hypothetical protein
MPQISCTIQSVHSSKFLNISGFSQVLKVDQRGLHRIEGVIGKHLQALRANQTRVETYIGHVDSDYSIQSEIQSCDAEWTTGSIDICGVILEQTVLVECIQWHVGFTSRSF